MMFHLVPARLAEVTATHYRMLTQGWWSGTTQDELHELLPDLRQLYAHWRTLDRAGRERYHAYVEAWRAKTPFDAADIDTVVPQVAYQPDEDTRAARRAYGMALIAAGAAPEPLTTTQVAELLGMQPPSVSAWAGRRGITPYDRTSSGEAIWDGIRIRAARKDMPGQGTRTDLHTTREQQ